jgi:hypothetical protein
MVEMLSKILKPARLMTLGVKQSELPRTLQPAEEVGVELITSRNRSSNAPKARCLVHGLGRMWAQMFVVQ